MPAPAVIPAPIAYIKVVAVKKLVVGVEGAVRRRLPKWLSGAGRPLLIEAVGFVPAVSSFTLKKLECSKQDLLPLNIAAWDNEIGLSSYFVGFQDEGND